MTSEVGICNIALAHLGDTATVASLDPPEGSAQAEHCARFYPVARDVLLESHTWGFATRRAVLAELVNDQEEWLYSYAPPSDMLRAIAVMPSGGGDYSESLGPQPFVVEVNSSGAQVILTNLHEAKLRYTAMVTDPTFFSPLFVTALSWQLAALLAGPIIKGEQGADEARRCLQMAQAYGQRAAASDSRQRMVRPTHTPAWMAVR